MFTRRFLFTAALLFSLFSVAPAFAADFTSGVDHGLYKEYALETKHFHFEYSDLTAQQLDSDADGIPDLIETLADAAEDSWTFIVKNSGYKNPAAEDPLVVILDDNDEYLTSGEFGISFILNNETYIIIDPFIGEAYLRGTMAHEFFHAVQFAYSKDFVGLSQPGVWAEATAVWMAQQIFPEVEFNLISLPDFFDYPDYSIFASVPPSGSLYEYGLNIWAQFLSEYYDPLVIKDIFKEYDASSESNKTDLKLPHSVEDVLEGEGDALPEIFQEFTLWNLNRLAYEEGQDYPDVLLLSGELSDSYLLPDTDFAPALYGSNYLYFENAKDQGFFRFQLVKPEGIEFALSLVPYDGETYDLSRAVKLIIDEDEDAATALDLSELAGDEAVVAVISPLDRDFRNGMSLGAYDQGYIYYYQAEFANKESELEESEDTDAVEVDASGDVKEENSAGDGSDVSLQSTLVLALLTYDEDSATFSWNRFGDASLDHYILRYGEEFGVYEKAFETQNTYTTFAAIHDLKEGQSYYFELAALDEEDEELEKSNTIVLTPKTWLFTDLSYLDEHYNAIQALVEEGVFKGYPNGSFLPDKDINRAELLKILIEAQGFTPNGELYKDCFPDVGEEWFASYICYAKEQNWVQGYPDGQFRPGDTVNKVEALKMLFQVYGWGLSEEGIAADLTYPDLDSSAWYAIYVWKAYALGILEESDGRDFSPSSGRHRGDMAEELYRYLVVTDVL